MEEEQYFENRPFFHETDDYTNNEHYYSTAIVRSIMIL